MELCVFVAAAWYNSDAAADVFIAWRYSISLAVSRGSRARYVWLHDVCLFSPSHRFAWLLRCHYTLKRSCVASTARGHERAASVLDDAVDDARHRAVGVPRVAAVDGRARVGQGAVHDARSA
jgi:hypothetical protein